ncbi:hypothetical protein CUMW_276280 [Citrus unshiu]|uniref:Uncharacterized protein n=1 Tax=Citrus unshiu TaxID=55188 RepID=A0A2H5N1X6_CITUN|nr:hypothetical protein CUMW_276280 [Citrus unshiu]
MKRTSSSGSRDRLRVNDRQIWERIAWREEILLVLPISALAFALSFAMFSFVKWKTLCCKLGGGVRVPEGSMLQRGRRMGKYSDSERNPRSRTGSFQIQSEPREISDQELKKCQKEVPSTTE